MKVSRVYDVLAAFERRVRGRRTYPIHKSLNLPGGSDLVDYIFQQTGITFEGHLLDAGCGVGDTAMKFCRRNPENRATGVSLSKREIGEAKNSARQSGLADRCRFAVRSYDEQFEEQFDLIIGIESLKHSYKLNNTMANLTGALRPGGKLIIADDFATSQYFEMPDDLRDSFEKFWALSMVYTKTDFVSQARSVGMQIHSAQDMTSYMDQQAADRLQLKYRRFGRLKKLMPWSPGQDLIGIFQAGVALEYFYSQGAFTYELLIFEK